MKKQAKGPRFRARFRVGQVVAIRNGYRDQGRYFRIAGFQLGMTEMHAYFTNGERVCQSVMRPLTAREAGPARGRKR